MSSNYLGNADCSSNDPYGSQEGRQKLPMSQGLGRLSLKASYLCCFKHPPMLRLRVLCVWDWALGRGLIC